MDQLKADLQNVKLLCGCERGLWYTENPKGGVTAHLLLTMKEELRLKITDYILKPLNYEEFGSCIDNLKISLFERRAVEASGQEEERVITSITRYVQEHLAEEVSLSVLAEEFHLSAQYISQLFKSEIGVGFLNYPTSIRMEKARKLLVSTDLSIAEVAESRRWGLSGIYQGD